MDLRRFPLLLFLISAACSSGGTEPPPEPECGYHSDCPTGQVCYESECHGTVSCIERSNCAGAPVCANNRCFCEPDSNRCLPVCVTDNNCPSDGHCVDGVCTPYPVQFDGMAPQSSERTSLMVGMARVDLDFPMGVSMAGYGSRQGPRTPYQDSLGGSNAWLDRPDVRSLVFDDGKEMFVLLRIPMSWTTDYMVTETARKVQEQTGLNLIDRIVTTAPHSHSHPARYWHLVDGLGFGFFGYGEFNYEIFDRLTASFAEAIVLALGDMQPARFGYTVLDDFDPENRIHRDRRQQNNNLPGYRKKDDRMLLMRVDDAAGEPIAVLSNFGIHGTVFGADNPILTGDAGGGVEVELTHRASAKYQRPVMGFFLQGNAGDISPAGGDRGHEDTERLQVIGRRTWEVIDPALDSIQTSDQLHVSVISGRLPISLSTLGYGEGEFFDSNVSCDSTPQQFRYGAFQCVEGFFRDEDPATGFTDGSLGCLFGVECLTQGHPVPQFQKTRLAIARLGDLALITMPGEPLSQFGRDISDLVQETITDVNNAAVLGYSMDHHFYLLNEDDWLQGGYEPSRDIWGWRLGPFLSDNAVKLAKELNQEPPMRSFDEGNLKPMFWDIPEEERTPVPFTETEGEVGIAVLDVPEQVERLDEVNYAWVGGHPGLDQPRITLQVEVGQDFETFKRPGDLPYTDAGFEMMVIYDGDCGRTNCDAQAHPWRVRWQEQRDFPLGRYRLQAEGRAFKNGQITEYITHSATFEIVPSTKLNVYNLSATAGQLEGRIVDPPALVYTTTDDGVEADRGAILLRSVEVPSSLGAPLPEAMQLAVTGTIRPVGTSTETPFMGQVSLDRMVEPRQRLVGFDAMGAPLYQGAGEQPTSRFVVDASAMMSSGDYVLSVSLMDPLGNQGTVTATVTVP